jgi:[ribosomal protein S5]-alanine N-acetyltransferase
VNVTLRALQLEDVESVITWALDQEFCEANDWAFPNDPERLQAHWTRLITEPRDDFKRLAIALETKIIGYADLALIDWEERRASFGIAIARAHWGRGLAARGGTLMLEHGFNELGLERIVAEVHANNERSLRLMQRLGFLQEGVLRQHETYRGVKQDVVLFGMLRAEHRRSPLAASS